MGLSRLCKPNKYPEANMQFMLVFCARIFMGCWSLLRARLRHGVVSGRKHDYQQSKLERIHSNETDISAAFVMSLLPTLTGANCKDVISGERTREHEARCM